MMSEYERMPEINSQIESLNRAFNKKLSSLLGNEPPYSVIVQGYKPDNKPEMDSSRLTQLKQRIFGSLPTLSEVVDMDFSTRINLNTIEYDFLTIKFTNGTRLMYHTTNMGMTQYLAREKHTISNMAVLLPPKFASILEVYNLPPSLNVIGATERSTENVLSELSSADNIRFEQQRTISINPQTILDVQSATTYSSDQNAKISEQEVALYLQQDDESAASEPNTVLFKVDASGKGRLYTTYNCPLNANQLLGKQEIPANRAIMPSVSQIEQLNLALKSI